MHEAGLLRTQWSCTTIKLLTYLLLDRVRSCHIALQGSLVDLARFLSLMFCSTGTYDSALE